MKASASQQKPLCNRQGHTGPAGGITIPGLPEDATDDDILAALANLDTAQKKLLEKRKALAEEAEEVLMSGGPDISEDQAVLRSNQIKGILKESKKGITNLTGIGDI